MLRYMYQRETHDYGRDTGLAVLIDRNGAVCRVSFDLALHVSRTEFNPSVDNMRFVADLVHDTEGDFVEFIRLLRLKGATYDEGILEKR